MTKHWVISLIMILLVQGCSLAPKYKRPSMPIPLEYKEGDTWVLAKPSMVNKGYEHWWEIFEDPILNDLEQKVTISNQDLQAALARYENALGALKVSESGLYPSIIAVSSVNRQQTSTTVANPSINPRYNDRLIGLDLSYELDLWGKVRNAVYASKNRAQASKFDLAALELSLHAMLATHYFTLCSTDAKIKVLDQLIVAYEKALTITQNRFNEGLVAIPDVYQAQTQLENTKASKTENTLIRAQLEHAIAILTGIPPALFTLATTTQKTKIPLISPTLPSTLLERRPDVAAAEKRVMAANAEIGVARAAFFPDINLVGTLGFESASFKNLFNSDSLFWSLGPQLSQWIFSGGKLEGLLDEAKAVYYETAANYRQTVLNAFGEVEDNLAAQKLLEIEINAQKLALIAANNAQQQAVYRYEGGVATFLDVVILENIALQAQLAEIDTHARRQITSVLLMKALGGGWWN
jgi:NodT family efflux transporter outer membrane factor (OMF) lipoprotein